MVECSLNSQEGEAAFQSAKRQQILDSSVERNRVKKAPH